MKYIFSFIEFAFLSFWIYVWAYTLTKLKIPSTFNIINHLQWFLFLINIFISGTQVMLKKKEAKSCFRKLAHFVFKWYDAWSIHQRSLLVRGYHHLSFNNSNVLSSINFFSQNVEGKYCTTVEMARIHSYYKMKSHLYFRNSFLNDTRKLKKLLAFFFIFVYSFKQNKVQRLCSEIFLE